MKLHITVQGRTYTVRIGDIQTRPIQAEVDGEVFEVWPEETLVPKSPPAVISQAARIAPPVPPADVSGGDQPDAQSAVVAAPIPGVIVEITVKAGDSVNYGQELCVLEAMKMKNSIRAGRDGVIKQVNASIGDHVHQGQVLVEFEGESK